MPGGETVRGSLSVLFLYDVSDEIDLPGLREILGAQPARRERPTREPAPEYVQFAKPPVVEPIDGIRLEGEPIAGRLAYYEYGVVSVKLETPFEGSWQDVVAAAAKWTNSTELERRASDVVRARLEKIGRVLDNPYAERLVEDYYIVHIRSISIPSGEPVTAPYLIDAWGPIVAQIVRGETIALSASERAEILESRMSYYDTDLVVAGWSTAVVYDTPEGAAPTIQLLEYANTQLLEFRHYDAALSRLLSEVHRSLEKGTGFLARWRLAREAARLNAVRLEIRELTERVDNSIKFLSDMFAARLYRMAAARIGVPDYRTLVDQKLQSAGELYGFLMDRFYQGRAFALELMVVVILIVELAFLFRGSPQ